MSLFQSWLLIITLISLVLHCGAQRDTLTIAFVGDADLINTLGSSDGSALDANTGLGVTLSVKKSKEAITFKQIDLSLVINVASTSDTLGSSIRDLGYYLLRPINKKQSASFTFDGYFKYPKGEMLGFVKNNIDGVHFDLVSSTNLWRGFPEVDDNGDLIPDINLAGLSFSLGLFKEWVNDENRVKKNYSFKTGINWIWKRVIGDLAFPKYKALREKYIGSERVGHNGFEIYASIRMRNIQASVVIPFLRNGLLGLNTGEPDIEGLTNSQLLTSISFVGGFPLSTVNEKDQLAGALGL